MAPRKQLLALALAIGLGLTAACGSSDSSGGSAEGSDDSAFPVSIKHKFGTAKITAKPKRVLAIGFNEQDFTLALGVTPVGVREFLGYDAPNRPWAKNLLKGKKLPTVGSEELNLEKIATLDPDVILAVNSFIDDETYGLLSKIAPTVAQSADYADGATPWQQQTLLTGKALGETTKAREVVRETEALFAKAVEENPEFKGRTAAFALGADDTGTFSLGADDYRTGWLTELGFIVPKKSGQVSLEKVSALDKDVLIGEGIPASVSATPVVKGLAAVREGRYLDLGDFDEDFAAALGFNSPLSIPTLLDIAVPRLAAAADDDPATKPAPFPES